MNSRHNKSEYSPQVVDTKVPRVIGGMYEAKVFKFESDFETSIFRCGFVKILANPLGFAAFCASHTKKSFIYKILRP